ncbi:MAG: hypothetical protein JOY81_05095 [Alphaproteobacteria bacterium]|nr:hypothetical protein [Alphaproteobacteria bacterium]
MGVGGQLGLVEVVGDGRIAVSGTGLGQQAMAGTDDLGEEVVLGGEMGVEAATGQARRQHDVVDVGAGIAAQPEQAGGVPEDLVADGGLAAGADRHLGLIICLLSYHMIIDI